MAEATTLKPKEGETPQPGEATTPEGKQAITSGDKGQGSPATPEEQKTVAELEEQVGVLSKQLEEQRTLQSQADRKRRVSEIERGKLEKQLASIRNGETPVEENIPADETSVERETRLMARVAIQNLLLDNPDYQKLLEQDVTLKEVLKNNPFVLIKEYIDTEDAVDQIKQKLDERISSLAKANPKEEKKEGEGSEFETGPVQPKEGKPAPPLSPTAITPDEKLEESIKSKIRITT